METTVFLAPESTLLSGLFVGIIFGFLLRKALVTRFDVIVGQMLLRDFTVMKVIMTAIAFGSIGIYALHAWYPELPWIISKATILSTVIGGGIFGIGMSLMGYCPGTGMGALADGAQDMWFGMLGMIAGAALYAELFPWITAHIKPTESFTKITLPEYFNVSPWIVIAAVFCALGGLALFDTYFMENQEK